MKTTCHSEFGKLKSIYIKRAADAFIDDTHIEKHWRELNFLSKPDLAKANSEYFQFENLIAGTGAQVYHLPADSTVTMDSNYCRDAALATDYGMILCNMGKPARVPEPAAEKRAFEMNNIKILGEIKSNKLRYKEVPVKIVYTNYSMSKGQSWKRSFSLGTKMIIKKIMRR